MEKIPAQFIKEGKNVQLSDKEKAALARNFSRYMDEHPHPKRFVWYESFHVHIASRFVVGFAVAVLVIGSTMSFAAEGSVPGKVLYPVKTVVNESVMKAVARAPQSKAKLNVRLAERRLEEIEKLATDAKSDKENIKKLTEQVKVHVASTGTFVKTIDSESQALAALDVNTELKSVLDAHEGVIAAIEDSQVEGSGEEDMTDVIVAVAEQQNAVDEVHAALEEYVTHNSEGGETQIEIDGDVEEAEEKIEIARDALEDIRDSVSADVVEQVEISIAQAEQALNDGMVKSENERGEAAILINHAEQIASEVRIFAEAHEGVFRLESITAEPRISTSTESIQIGTTTIATSTATSTMATTTPTEAGE